MILIAFIPALMPVLASNGFQLTDNMHFFGLFGLCFAFYCVDRFKMYIIRVKKRALLYIKMVFCATVPRADLLYSLDFSVVVKDVHVCK